MGAMQLTRLLWTAALAAAAAGHVFTLRVENDTRRVIDFGVFGFAPRGTLQVAVRRLSLADPAAPRAARSIGFTFDRVATAFDARREKTQAAARPAKCFVSDDAVMPEAKAKDRAHRINLPLGMQLVEAHGALGALTLGPMRVQAPGLYALFFYNCKRAAEPPNPAGNPPPVGAAGAVGAAVSFEVEVTLYNYDEAGAVTYASHGRRFVAEMYIFFTAIFVVLLGFWARELVTQRERVHRIHHLMTALLVFKVLALFFMTGKEFVTRRTGRPSAWSVFYYVFLTLRGTMLFVIILLVGAGWSVIRPFLRGGDKKLVACVLPLQVALHAVLAYLEETSDGDAVHSSWRDTLLLMDVLCCLVVVLPTVWSIKQISQSADNLDPYKLHLLRQFKAFYFLVCLYFYITRLLVPYIETKLSYANTWWAPFLTECTAVVFYVMGARHFLPRSDPSGLSRAEPPGDRAGVQSPKGRSLPPGSPGRHDRRLSPEPDHSHGHAHVYREAPGSPV